MTEDQLRVVNGLVAHARRLEQQFLRTRSVKRGDELWVQLDHIRWELQHLYGVTLVPYKRKPEPSGPGDDGMGFSA